jgi:hypothetical protein
MFGTCYCKVRGMRDGKTKLKMVMDGRYSTYSSASASEYILPSIDSPTALRSTGLAFFFSFTRVRHTSDFRLQTFIIKLD